MKSCDICWYAEDLNFKVVNTSVGCFMVYSFFKNYPYHILDHEYDS